MRPHVTDLVDKLSQGIMCRRLDPGIDGAAVSGLHQVGESEQRVAAWGRSCGPSPTRSFPARSSSRSRRSRRELGVHVMSVPRASYVMRRWLLRDRRAAPR